jgi:hypothetical protein
MKSVEKVEHASNFRSNFGSKFNQSEKENEPVERSFSKRSMQSFKQNPDTMSKVVRPDSLNLNKE